MSFDEKLADAKIELMGGEHLPPGQRTVKAVQRVIAAARALERDSEKERAELNSQISAATSSERKAIEERNDLVELVSRLQDELRELRAKTVINGPAFESLTVESKERLLGAIAD